MNFWKLLNDIFENLFTLKVETKRPASIPESSDCGIYVPEFEVKPKAIIKYKDNELDKLICGLGWAESRSTREKINYDTIGDKNIPDHAYGYLQIRIGVLSQVNQLWGTKYKVTDLLGEEGAKLSYKVCVDYLTKILPQYKSYKLALKAGISLNEIYAKSWNGGCGFFQFYNTPNYERYSRGLDNYWETVKRGMK